MIEFVSTSYEDTVKKAESFAKTCEKGTVIGFLGGLGMGKTAFCRGFAKGMGYEGEVSSPTFAIVHEYSGGRLNIYHFDMYRIESFDDLYSTGYFEYLESGGVVITEWSENIENVLPENYTKVEIVRGSNDNNSRIITVEKITQKE